MNYRLKPTMPQLAVFISLVGLLILLSGNALQPAAAQTTLPRFNLAENAVLLEDRLRLTIDQPDQRGAAWLPEKQQVQNGFEATFDWQITKTTQQGGDGFAFVIHNADLPFPAIALGNGRNGLGYSGLPNSLAIEFDTVKNLPGEFDMGSRGDPNDNHISVQSRGKDANNANTDFSLGFTTQTEPAIPLFTVGRHRTRIVYKPGDSSNPGNIAIYLDNMETSILNANANLEELLSLDEGKAWVGFTAATGRRSQTHDVFSFSFVGTEDENPSNFNAQLGGDQEVPPRTTNAAGQATLQIIDEARLDFTLNLPNIKNFVAAHIHCAPAGENGPVGVTLYGPLAPGGGLMDTFSVQRTITAPDAENGCEWADLAAVVEAMRSGNAYVNVHTDDGVDPPDTGPGDFPDGEIRGQIK